MNSNSKNNNNISNFIDSNAKKNKVWHFLCLISFASLSFNLLLFLNVFFSIITHRFVFRSKGIGVLLPSSVEISVEHFSLFDSFYRLFPHCININFFVAGSSICKSFDFYTHLMQRFFIELPNKIIRHIIDIYSEITALPKEKRRKILPKKLVSGGWVNLYRSHNEVTLRKIYRIGTFSILISLLIVHVHL